MASLEEELKLLLPEVRVAVNNRECKSCKDKVYISDMEEEEFYIYLGNGRCKKCQVGIVKQTFPE